MFFDIFNGLCLEKNLTMNKACIEIGISRTATAKWKNGSVPNGQTLSKIADFFEVGTNYLLEKSIVSKSNKALAHNIVNARNDANMSQADLASALGIKVEIIASIEKGAYRIDSKLLSRISDILNIEPEILDGSITDENEKNTPAAPSDEDIKVALFGGDTEVTDEMWSEVMNYAEFIKQKYKKT